MPLSISQLAPLAVFTVSFLPLSIFHIPHHPTMSVTSLLRLGLAIVALLLLVGQVTADLELSGDELADYYRNIKRDSDALSECLKSPGMQEHNARAIAYHNETLHKLRKARGIDPNLGAFANHVYPHSTDKQ
jgi:hypothetical protein